MITVFAFSFREHARTLPSLPGKTSSISPILHANRGRSLSIINTACPTLKTVDVILDQLADFNSVIYSRLHLFQNSSNLPCLFFHYPCSVITDDTSSLVVGSGKDVNLFPIRNEEGVSGAGSSGSLYTKV